MKKIITLLSLALAFVSIISCSSSSSPSDVVEKYVKCIMNEDKDGAFNLFYFSGIDAKTIETNKEKMIVIFDRFVKPEFDKNGGVVSYVIGEEIVSEDGLTATVAFEYVYGNEKVEPMNSRLKKIDGKWYLDSGK